MNALIGATLESGEEIPGDAVFDTRLLQHVTADVARRGRRLGPGEAVPYGWLLGPFLLILFWSTGSAAGLIDPRVLPAPWTTAATAWELIRDGHLQDNLAVSAVRAAEGFAWGVGAGVLVALISGLSQLGGYVFDGLVQIKRAIPTLALIPLVILWFGIDESAKLFLVAIGVFFPIYLNTYHGIKSVDAGLVEMARSYGLKGWPLYREVILPGALPSILVGLRFSLGLMWVLLIVAETISAQSGMGYMTMNAREFLKTDVVLVGVLLYAFLGKLADLVARGLERRFLRWNPAYAGLSA